jgi:hypothetical protein
MAAYAIHAARRVTREPAGVWHFAPVVIHFALVVMHVATAVM